MFMLFYFVEASYVWKRNDEVVAKGNSLILNNPVTRGGDGEYVCEATNKHGTATGTTHLNVMCTCIYD